MRAKGGFFNNVTVNINCYVAHTMLSSLNIETFNHCKNHMRVYFSIDSFMQMKIWTAGNKMESLTSLSWAHNNPCFCCKLDYWPQLFTPPSSHTLPFVILQFFPLEVECTCLHLNMVFGCVTCSCQWDATRCDMYLPCWTCPHLETHMSQKFTSTWNFKIWSYLEIGSCKCNEDKKWEEDEK